MAFDFELAGVHRFQPDVLYLAPRPDHPFRQLTQLLVGRYPQTPPYGGAFETVVPHLTVAQGAEPPVLDAITSVLEPALPIAARAKEIWLMQSGDDGYWRFRTSFPLVRERPPSGRADTR